MRRTRSSLLLLDVDGVISLFGFDHDTRPPGRFVMVDGIPHYLSADAGPQLARLAGAFECVWCTGWEEKANEHLPLALGLAGPFPHLVLGEPAPGRHWKLAAIDAYAGAERPLAWVDDAHDATCEAWARERPGATLLVGTEPSVGLTGAQVETLLAWAAAQEA